jgi:hypothetical protein
MIPKMREKGRVMGPPDVVVSKGLIRPGGDPNDDAIRVAGQEPGLGDDD